jgi:hypothetical protein
MQKHHHLLVPCCHQFVCRVTFWWLKYHFTPVRVSLFPRAAPYRIHLLHIALLPGSANAMGGSKEHGHVGVGQIPIPQLHGHVILAAPTKLEQLQHCVAHHPAAKCSQTTRAGGVPSVSCEFGSAELILRARYSRMPHSRVLCCTHVPSGVFFGGVLQLFRRKRNTQIWF